MWDGASFKVSGALICVPDNQPPFECSIRCTRCLYEERHVREAEAALSDLKMRGLIGDFDIPNNASQLPPLDIMLDIQFVEGVAPEPLQQATGTRPVVLVFPL